jgi:predicted nucleic acid-binding protein
MVSVDAGILSLLLYPSARAPLDPNSKLPVERAHERVEQLIDDLEKAKERIIIPAPALSEFLVLAAQDGPQYLNELSLLPHVHVEPFDQMAAIELAAMELQARKGGAKRSPLPPSIPWQKVKVDRQIVAISKLHQCKAIYSDDAELKALAEAVGIKAVSTWELSLPQSKIPLLDDCGPLPPPQEE